MRSVWRSLGRAPLLAALQTCVILALSVFPQTPRADAKHDSSVGLRLPAVAGIHTALWKNDRGKQQCFETRASEIPFQLSGDLRLRRLAERSSSETRQPRDRTAYFEAGRSPPMLLHFAQ